MKCVSVRRPLTSFTRRYARWNVMQHQCAGLLAYLGLLLENPTLLATLAAVVKPGAPTFALLLGCATSRMATDALASRLLRGRAFHPRVLLAGGLKDILSGAAWAYGLVSHSIEWRSNRLVVLSGSRLRIKQPGGGWVKALVASAPARRAEGSPSASAGERLIGVLPRRGNVQPQRRIPAGGPYRCA